MGIVILILTGTGLLGAFLGLIFHRRKKADYQKRCQRAARRILREEYLDGSIVKKEDLSLDGSLKRTMLLLKTEGSRDKGCVFDPMREVRIGRNLEVCDVCLADPAVSSYNSRIFLFQGQVCVQDMDSANGTAVKPPWGSWKYLWGGTDFLYDKSRLRIGNTCMEIRIFSCEAGKE